ncbi:kinase-like protein, partial [Atractiella rhizophila]
PLTVPLSLHIPLIPSTRSKASSIKDFEVIKPISKGAFGSVYLARKKITGDYYVIKVLKKSDMIAKNQVTNVKTERMILMNQAKSDFVARLFYTFQSKDYLYLVMEYLNGGDCAAFLKMLGSFSEEWSQIYVAEITLGLGYLHNSGIVHRFLPSKTTNIPRVSDGPIISFLAGINTAFRSHPNNPSRSNMSSKHVVGSPDYLPPESILGIGIDEGVDWWALGVILYEFLYGIPPFHAATPAKVFERFWQVESIGMRMSWRFLAKRRI